MQVPDAAEIARILSQGPVKGRKKERKNLVRRFRKGHVHNLTQRDLHYIRQARFIARVGWKTYHDLHTFEGITIPMTEIPDTLRTFYKTASDVFGNNVVDMDPDIQTVAIIRGTMEIVFAYDVLNDAMVCVVVTGSPTPETLTKLADLNTRLSNAVERAFLNGLGSGKSDFLAQQVQLAAFGRQAGSGPIYV